MAVSRALLQLSPAQQWSNCMSMTQIPIRVTVGAIFSLIPGVAWAQQGPTDADRYGYGPHMMWWGGGWHGMIFGPLLMILLLAAAIAVALLLVRWLGGPWHSAAPSPSSPAPRAALDILKERFARGEIDKSEYEERRRVLGE
jgi:putative membrane protein